MIGASNTGPQYQPLVSVIIPTRNEEAHIVDCIASIRAQTYDRQKMQIIVVDNCSSDRTAGLAASLGVEFHRGGPERSAQRNYGARLARGRYLLFLDADMILSKNVIAACVQYCEQNDSIGLYIPEKIPGTNLWARWRTFERSFYNATCIDGIRFVRRRSFFAVNGFDESLTSAEDWDLTRRLARHGQLSIVTLELFHNESGMTLRQYLQKKAYYANLSRRYIDKWGPRDPLVRRQFGLYYRYCGVFVEKGKWRRIVRHPLLFGCVIAVKAMIGALFLAAAVRRDGSPASAPALLR